VYRASLKSSSAPRVRASSSTRNAQKRQRFWHLRNTQNFRETHKSAHSKRISKNVPSEQAQTFSVGLYPPQEDSHLLQKYVKKHARGLVLEIGTGSGIQALTAAKKKSVTKVTAVDINKKAIKHCKKTIKNKKITFKISNLFSKITSKKFDTIIFNPPYLPHDPNEDGQTALQVAGGKQGHEILERFLKEAGNHLKPTGIMLIIFSSLTNKQLIDQIIEQHGFISEHLDEKSFFYEKLYCYKITWNDELKNAQELGIKNIKYFTHGKRGLIFTANYKNKKVAIKIKRPSSQAFNRINIEATWLKKINRHNIGPKLQLSGNGFIVYSFIEGDFIPYYIEKNNKQNIKKTLIAVLNQCYQLDKLNINKEEMHHPPKHIIIGNNKPILIDFERTRTTNSPKNVTQFVQYINRLQPTIKNKGFTYKIETLRKLANSYKHKQSQTNLKKIIKEL
jgi:release factor glutamine methyltransferase